jgi:hypothetical protein
LKKLLGGTRMILQRGSTWKFADLVGGSLVNRLGDGEGLVFNCFKGGLQQMQMLLKISMDYDKSVLSCLLALRNTA